jgi:hypothetical protein
MRAFLEDAAVRGWSKLRPIRNRRFASRLTEHHVWASEAFLEEARAMLGGAS